MSEREREDERERDREDEGGGSGRERENGKGGGRNVIDEGKSEFENIELNSFFNLKEARVEGR